LSGVATATQQTKITVGTCECIGKRRLRRAVAAQIPHCTVTRVIRRRSVEGVFGRQKQAEACVDMAITDQSDGVVLITHDGCQGYANYYKGGNITPSFLAQKRPEHLRCALGYMRAHMDQLQARLTIRVLLVRSRTVDEVTPAQRELEAASMPSRTAHRRPRRQYRRPSPGALRVHHPGLRRA